MTEHEPPNGLTDDERTQMTARRDHLLAEADRLCAEAKLIDAELAADDMYRLHGPGLLPRPTGPNPTDLGSR